MLRKLEQLPEVSAARKAVRLWYVARYYRGSQLVWRLVSLARRRWLRLTGGRRYARVPEVRVEPGTAGDLALLAERKLDERSVMPSRSTAEKLLCGRYRFLGFERTLPDPIDWRLRDWPDAACLWRFHLHYHEFLLDLMAAARQSGRSSFCDRAWDVVTQWIEGNPLSDHAVLSDAWHPFCISRRLPVWISLWSASPPDDAQRGPILAGIFRQARFLEDHLERDLGGNHLLENARALVLAGCFLGVVEADRWRRKGAAIFKEELRRQILPHGEHFERSPGYHAEMLDAMLDVRDATRTLMPDLSALCAATAEEMAAFLDGILHADGDVPLWGDCWLLGAELLQRRLRAAGVSPRINHEQRQDARAVEKEPADGQDARASQKATVRRLGDCWIYRDGGDYLLWDTGPVGPDHLPAHAHADLLSFEASLGGRRLFVDSGVCGYEDDLLRRYCRSTAAHNVLQIDDADQCDLWSRFRMGYRGWPLGFRSGKAGDFHWAAAWHNAYRRLGVPTVGRWIACRPGGPWACVDSANGRGVHKLAFWLHLHPDVIAEQVSDDEVLLDPGARQCRLRFLKAGQIAITDGWYCPEFGRHLPAPAVLWTASAVLPAVCGWSLSWQEPHQQSRLDVSEPGKATFCWGDERILVEPASASTCG